MARFALLPDRLRKWLDDAHGAPPSSPFGRWARDMLLGSLLQDLIRRHQTRTLTTTTDNRITDRDGLLLVDATAGHITVTMPKVFGREGREWVIQRIDDSLYTVTIEPEDTDDTILGETSITITAQYTSRTMRAEGNTGDEGGIWYVI